MHFDAPLRFRKGWMISIQKKQQINKYFNKKNRGLGNWCHQQDTELFLAPLDIWIRHLKEKMRKLWNYEIMGFIQFYENQVNSFCDKNLKRCDLINNSNTLGKVGTFSFSIFWFVWPPLTFQLSCGLEKVKWIRNIWYKSVY